MSSLSFLIASRKHVRSSVTRLHNDMENYVLYDDLKRRNVKLKLEGLRSEIGVLDGKITALNYDTDEDETGLENELTICDQYSDKIGECITLLNCDQSARSDVRDTSRSLLKSPVASLPRFSSAEGENLELFLRQFEETLSKFTCTEYDKLLLLKQQIVGKALKALFLIDSLDADSQTYTEAKKLLVSALTSLPVQKFNVIKQMSELKHTYSSEPFQYISDIRKMMQAVKQLNVTIDDVMQYFFFIGMNESYKNSFILVTNNSKPTLHEIVDKFFVAKK